MKYLYYFPILLLFISCNSKTTNFESSLLHVADSLDSNAEYALDYLERCIFADTLNTHNKAFYFLLLTEAKDKNGLNIFLCDSMMDYSIEHLSKKKYPILSSKSYFYKGKILSQINNYDMALEYYNNALSIADNSTDTALISKIHSYLGDLFLIRNMKLDAMEQYHISYQLDLLTGNKKDIVIALRNLGLAKVYIEEYDSAHYYYDKALYAIGSNNDLDYLKDHLYNDLSICYTETGDFEAAKEWINKVSLKSDGVYANKGFIFLQLQQYDSARLYLEKCIESANIYSKASAYYDLAELEKQSGNTNLSYQYLCAYLDISDSIQQLSNTSELQRLVYNNNLELQEVKLESKHYQRTLVLIATSILILLTASFIFLLINNKKKTKLLEQSNKLKTLENEISELNLQIEKLNNESLNASNLKLHLLSVIERKKKEVAKKEELLFKGQLLNFKKKKCYLFVKKIKKENDLLSLMPEDKDLLKKDILYTFSNFAIWLQAEFPELKKDDVYLCILIKAGVAYNKVHLLTGNKDSNAIRQRKHRIKNILMKSPEGKLYFESIFGNSD